MMTDLHISCVAKFSGKHSYMNRETLCLLIEVKVVPRIISDGFFFLKVIHVYFIHVAFHRITDEINYVCFISVALIKC